MVAGWGTAGLRTDSPPAGFCNLDRKATDDFISQ
ncbi:hypothetical protein ACVWWI_006488 [Bradyrhizobium sp. USDA 3686]|nr:hypothetical protein [Bradyrhizobium canariense]